MDRARAHLPRILTTRPTYFRLRNARRIAPPRPSATGMNRQSTTSMPEQLDLAAGEIGTAMFSPGDLRSILARVLPEDASALQFQPIGGGLTHDPDATPAGPLQMAEHGVVPGSR